MRLTLRTMLAYLDDVLDPNEAQQIGKKIEESENAASLVHRVRAAVRQPELPAPKLGGRAVDPNTVAEYLDNTLAADRVIDFEKICLAPDSNVYLAEVASCHQVLAAILGDPPEVDPRSKVRMYGILAEHEARLTQAAEQAAPGDPQKNDPAEAATAAAVSAAPPAAVGAGTSPASPPTAPPLPAENAATPRKKREVPNYLREPRTSRMLWRVAAILVLGVLLAGVAIMAVGPDWLDDFLGRPTPVAQNSNGDPNENTHGDSNAATSPTDNTNPPSPTPPSGVTPPRVTGDPTTMPSENTVPPENSGTVNPSPVNPATDPTTVATPPVPMVPAPMIPALPDGPTATTPPVGTSPAVDPAATGTASGTLPTPGNPIPPTVIASTAPVDPKLPTNPPAGEQLGMLNSQQTALFRRPVGGQEWLLTPVRGSVLQGDFLISPPAFRNVLLLRDFALHLRGDTMVQLSVDGDLPKISLYYGRMEILASDANTKVIIKAGDQLPALVTLTRPASGLAVECTPIRQPGEDPELKPPAYRVEVFASSGQFTWDTGRADQVYELTAKSRHVLGAEFKPPLNSDLPAWISGDEEKRLIMRQSAEQLANALQEMPTIRVEQRLEELSYDDSAKVELRSLARRSLVAVDRFQPALEALRKYDRSLERSPQFWPDYIDSLHKAALRNRTSARGLRDALVTLRGEEKGAELYRMLWGYTPRQLAAGEGQKLVNYLTHPDTDFRVLAEWNLTGLINGQARTTNTLHDGDSTRIKPYVEGLRRKLDSFPVPAAGEAPPAGAAPPATTEPATTDPATTEPAPATPPATPPTNLPPATPATPPALPSGAANPGEGVPF